MSALQKAALAFFMVFTVPFAALSDISAAGSVAAAAKTATVSGQILTTGKEPLAGGLVYFFNDAVGPPPAHEKYWRIPDFMKPLDKEGRFTVVLPEGRYYLGATKRLSGRLAGPPRDGDYYFVSVDEKGAPVIYSVKANTQIDLGKVAGAVPFKRSTADYGKGVTAIEGTILDNEGKPVADALVFAYVSPAAVGRPLFTSDATGADGKFILRVHDGGKYYLKVRSMYGGGPPVAGEFIGIYGEKDPVPATVSRGDHLTGLVINVRRFSGRGPQGGAK